MMYNSVCLANHRSILTFVMQSSVYIMISTYVSYRGLALDFNPINLSNESKSSSFTIMGHCRSGKTIEFRILIGQINFGQFYADEHP